MFESFDEPMKMDPEKAPASREQMVRWILIVSLSAFLFNGLYWIVHLLRGS